ncbi:MAG TPA: SDR family NAD(P)-dependent oxidoreductase [Natronosporangium sp.]
MDTGTPTTGQSRPLAVVTGASSGIGYALAEELGNRGFDLLVAAEHERIEPAASRLAVTGAAVEPVRVDLATFDGVEQLWERIRATGRPVEAVAINAGVGTHGEFARDTDLRDELNVIQLNVTSAVHLAKRVLPAMVEQRRGRLLFTSSVAATAPAPYQASYAASKAFIRSFAEALRAELKDTGVTVTALLPGPTETDFFERSGLAHSKLGRIGKDDPAEVARDGVAAMLAGDDQVVAGGARNKLQAAAARLVSEPAKARLMGKLSKPDPEPG